MTEIENNPHQALIEEKEAEFTKATLLFKVGEGEIEKMARLQNLFAESLQATINTVLEKKRRELLPFMQHDLQCATEFEAGDCDCGLKEALTPLPDKE